MGKGRPRAVEKGGLGPSSSLSSLSGSLNIPPAPVYYPTEEEFRDPLGFIRKIRREAEAYGICKIVPPKSWKPPFAIDPDSFVFATKTQAIHQLQARVASCDSKTFELEYNRFLEKCCGRKAKKKLVFEGEELDLCKLFNAVKRYGGYDKVAKEKKWGDVFRILGSAKKITDCAKHVLGQLYLEHLYDYEEYCIQLEKEKHYGHKKGMHVKRASKQHCVLSSQEKHNIHKRRVHTKRKSDLQHALSSLKQRRKNHKDGSVEICKVQDEQYDQICEQCKSGLHGEVMLLCDRCNKGWHIYCLSPPLNQVPPGNWYCLECLSSEKDSFGFVPGKKLSLEAFKRIAERARKKWFGSASASRIQVEKKFWEIVEGSVGEVEVMYGSDLDTSVYGSGFPRVNEKKPQSVSSEAWDDYCASPWNLNNLPKLQGSMLRAVRQSITGVMVPWLYIGMLFSSFCWHFEDHCFYSMNYLHWGAPKCWYSVPGSEVSAFEKVMRNSLPDLFDTQPDLLFQLVTMLNPSVLQENGVPVYSILQEPGNFVITFPRSYHAGFNFGLNCAEAVNFAPADWLPHGGYGAELYQLYHKAAVLSHEELLCVVAKSEFDEKASPYLKNELVRILDKERKWRELLWQNGIINFFPMSPRKHPEYMGTEEDPTCIICQQFLYLSAVTCFCRPSIFVCLEHWKHLCECKPNKHHLLYRHALAELEDLVHSVDKHCADVAAKDKIMLQQPFSSSSGVLLKKVRGGQHATLLNLAEEWQQRACKILQDPYLPEAYSKALKEVEEFLWAGSEISQVRNMKNCLIQAQNWAESVRNCVSNLELWSSHRNMDIKRVQMKHVENLLANPLPCNEPEHYKLKVYEQEAKSLINEIENALSTSSKIADLENLYAKSCDLPICMEESELLSERLSSAKAWIASVRECVFKPSPAMIDAHKLDMLKSKIPELKIQVSESERLLELVRQVEFCRSSCNVILKGPINLQQLEEFLQPWDGFFVRVPELDLLRQYKSDAVLWISRFSDVLANIHERDDQEAVVIVLISLQRDAALLKIEVDMLPRVETELKKAYWRVKALKALQCKMSLNFIQELLTDGDELQMVGEKLFSEIAAVLALASHWEDRAKHILEIRAPMSDFEDAIRTSEHICVNLPHIDAIKHAASMAESWLDKSKPFLLANQSMPSASGLLLKVDALKELVLQSEQLNVSLVECTTLQCMLENCIEWEKYGVSILQDAECTLNTTNIAVGISSGLPAKIECQVTTVETVLKTGLSLGFEFDVTQKLQDAASTLRWCLKALSLCTAPQLEEVELLLEAATLLPVSYASSALYDTLIDGMHWHKKALEILLSSNLKRFSLSDVEDVLTQYKLINMSFSSMVGQLTNAIQKHNLWLDQAHLFFGLKLADRSWISLLQLKDDGSTDAFNCSELDTVLSEVQKIDRWRQQCEKIALPSLINIKNSLDRSLKIFNTFKGSEERKLCTSCFCELQNKEFLDCSMCKDCFHLPCIESAVDTIIDARIYICPFCLFIQSGKLSRNGIVPLAVSGNYPDVKEFSKLLSDAEDLCVWMKERSILHEIVEKAIGWRACLIEIVDFALDFTDKDLNIIAEKLSVALKVVETAGVFDSECNRKFELALARNSWRIRADKLLEGSQKPSIQQVQRHIKEGQVISINLKDEYMQKLAEVNQIGLLWAGKAKQVSMDSGALGLNKVFELLVEGENLPVHCEKEIKLLRDRSMLYCICRKPYDYRDMIACDQCNEWYHFDCIGLVTPPNIYICPACEDQTEDDMSASLKACERSIYRKFEEPQTPSPRRMESSRKSKKLKSRKSTVNVNESNVSRHSRGIEFLFWQNRKPYRRVARKREEILGLSSFFHI